MRLVVAEHLMPSSGKNATNFFPHPIYCIYKVSQTIRPPILFPQDKIQSKIFILFLKVIIDLSNHVLFK